MSERAVIYARVSTGAGKQRDNYSIPTQVAACLRYAEERGYTVVGDRFIDLETGQDVVILCDGAVRAYAEGYTSRELSRPVLDAVFAYLEVIGFDVLIVHAIDRLARDPYLRETLERELRELGVRVEYVLGNYDETPEGEVRKDLDATFAKWETAKRVERCNRGKRKKAENGLFVAGRPPYGYVIDKAAFGGLAVVEEQAVVVRHIFHWYVEDKLSLRAIAKKLTKDQISPALGGKKWGKSSVVRILRNTIYVGYGFYNKHERVDARRLVERESEEWIKFETTPLVEQGVFDEAQRRLDENQERARRAPERFYLLSGMVICGHCGRAYSAQTAKAGRNRRVNDAQSYRHRKSAGHCMNCQISARRLEPAVWGKIEALLLDPENLRRGYEDSLAQQEATLVRQKAHLETLHRQAQKLQEQRQNLTTAYIDPDIGMTKVEYLEQKTKIDDELVKVSQEAKRIEEDLEGIPTPADLETFDTFASTIREEILSGKLTREVKREILELLHVQVIIYQDGSAMLEGWFDPDRDWRINLDDPISCDSKDEQSKSEEVLCCSGLLARPL